MQNRRGERYWSIFFLSVLFRKWDSSIEALAMPSCLVVISVASEMACTFGSSKQDDKQQSSLIVAGTPESMVRSRQIVHRATDDRSGSVNAYIGSDEWIFENSGRIGKLSLTSDKPWPGATITIEFDAQNLSGLRGVIGVLPTRRSSRQSVREDAKQQNDFDSRERWHELNLVDGINRLPVEMATPWHARTASVVLELLNVENQPIRVLSGPRSEMLRNGSRHPGGRAILAMLPVSTSPPLVFAPQVSEIVIDGQLIESIWNRTASVLVDSLEGEPVDEISTELWMAWSQHFLYLGASIEDSDIWSPFENRDDPLYKGEVFEFFVAADGSASQYIEYEVSAKNVQFDGRFAEYRKGDLAWDGQWQSAVIVNGTVDNPQDIDQGWTLEIAVPWSEICANTRFVCPPRPGDQLRVNVFRLEDLDRKRKLGLALSPTRKPDFHAWKHAARLVLQP